VSNEATTLYQEIDVLSQRVEPVYVDDREQRVESWIYEIPELQASLDWDVPTRGFKILEKTYKIVSGEKSRKRHSYAWQHCQQSWLMLRQFVV
jgi:hypothetical protein